MKPSLRALGAASLIAVAAIAVPSASAIGVTDVFKYGYEAYGKYKACMGNIDAGQKCLASDSQNIRQILKDVNALRAEIQGNQASTDAQLQRLQATLDNKVRNDLVTLLNPVTLNIPSALASYQGLMGCAEARVAGKATCADSRGAQVATAKAMADYQAVLTHRVGLMSDDIRSTAAVVSGSPLGGAGSGLIAANWDMHKHVQEADAGVTNAAVMSAMKVPVLTPSLANATTIFATTYDDILQSYGMLKPFVAGLSGRDAVAEAMQEDVQAAIYGKEEFSVASRAATFTLPALATNEIAFISQADGRAWIISPTRERVHRPGGYLLTPPAVFELGRAVNAYGVASTFREKRPAAFPKHGLYPVTVPTHYVEVCPRTTTWCNRTPFRVHQLARKSARMTVTGMRLLNSRPGWDKRYESTAYGTNGVNFKKDFAHFVTGPATFDWYVATYSPTNIGIDYEVGPGAWVEESAGSSPGVAQRLPAIPPMMG